MIGQPEQLVLRDIHQPQAPSWWPPAPGWWMLAIAILVVASAIAWWLHRRRQRAREVAAVFEQRLRVASSPVEAIAAMSELLRRAARRRDPQADRLQGEDWLRFLDAASSGVKADKQHSTPFSEGAGRLLLDGGYRRSAEKADVDALQSIARECYLALMATKR